ncbi:MAG: hypothetical protein HC769_13285 [Cyanobacteria bacterium CRU_2_1]|nr:hypothetical protein [Cyanobacteria bacterium RU_5_0]NJR59722.1 hypothetical protein [Cyanobacteria bacterium CRU_2_1]
MVEKQNRERQLDYKNSLAADRRFVAVPEAFRTQSSGLMVRSPHSPATVATASAEMSHWLRGKNLDYCLLAVCSCVLTLLCHQTVGVMPSHAMANGSAMTSSATTNAPAIDFAIKAGLFTTSSRLDEQEQPSE